MIIVKVEGSNFRTLQNFSLELEQGYFTVSGKNNCGKSSVFRIIRHFLSDDRDDYFYVPGMQISWQQDLTKWADNDNANLEISVTVEIHRDADAEVFFVVSSLSQIDTITSPARVRLAQRLEKDGTNKLSCWINEELIEDRAATEILKKLKSSNALIFHNSVSPGRRFYYGVQGPVEIVESNFTPENRKKIKDAQKNLENRVKSATKQHKGEIDKLLGKLQEKYQVELTSVDRSPSSTYSLAVSLIDKSVDVPLKDWGAGTQNRTRILMTLLEAIKKKTHSVEQERLTPVLLIEEPESFLHPSAQSDFGQVLASLAEEHGIQIFASTHSPYMLNTKHPAANILLDRKQFRGASRETITVDIAGKNWMLPFSKILGVVPDEFNEWSQIFGAQSGRVILVEGIIDVEYFRFFKDNFPDIYQIDPDVEVLPYNGKDALKNTQILKFMLGKMERSFITYDLDAEGEVQKKLEAIELVKDQDFCSVGRAEAGAGCIEGLLPKQIKAKVYAANVGLVEALTSANTKEKNEARDRLKQQLLDETKKSKLQSRDFPEFRKLFGKIHKAMALH